MSDVVDQAVDTTPLAERLRDLCRQQRVRITTAESCTGGGVASAITEVAGSSDYFETGYVTYANVAKSRLLGVPTEVIDSQGAVSRAVVEAMVVGACRESGADLGVAVSGVAGPGGGSETKPVGTVWLAWGDIRQQQAEQWHFSGDRRAVRLQSVQVALQGLIRWLESPEKM
ncbi:CinA family protein [Aidingimonas halophila]|uniref:Nicotinamide-nucleotide amidase n=1 Tax=Aidingimonas halophila TaxID=574349 RepID=A0A1H2VBU2_9GAMM|nr:CinA family protein [Aidingimonas halophila]GHC24074.1 damage-inducible protein CinA [Aidingimonas halophila]SDW65841.1 nicotinamide-nucleotide amidase [Aidingimonas halophila]